MDADSQPAARFVDVRKETWAWRGQGHALDGGHHAWGTPEGATVVTSERWLRDAHDRQNVGWKWRWTNGDVMQMAAGVAARYDHDMQGVERMGGDTDVARAIDYANETRTRTMVSIVHDHHGEVADWEYNQKKRLWTNTERCSTSAYYYPPYDPHVGCNHIAHR